jgi:hypothetical protein
MRAELVAAGLLVPSRGGLRRLRAWVAPPWRIDQEGLRRAAVEIFSGERGLCSRVIQHGDPRLAEPLRRLVARETGGEIR